VIEKSGTPGGTPGVPLIRFALQIDSRFDCRVGISEATAHPASKVGLQDVLPGRPFCMAKLPIKGKIRSDFSNITLLLHIFILDRPLLTPFLNVP